MIKSLNLAAAVEDLRKHNLSCLPSNLSRLIYLASTRDYNNGTYYHDGLAMKFSREIAGKALAACHQDTFERLVELPLEALVGEVEEYARTNNSENDQLVSVWQTLEPYRVVIPLASDPISVRLFCSNIKIALAVLESRAKRLQRSQSSASQQQ